MNDILAEISDAADNLEDELDDNLFEYAVLEQRKVRACCGIRGAMNVEFCSHLLRMFAYNTEM